MASAEIYDPATGQFTALAAEMASPRLWHTATGLPDGRAFFSGGTESGLSAELFNPAVPVFGLTVNGALTKSRISHTATLLGNGKVLLAGGVGQSTAELFDPAAEP